jgi:hypothetical protein
MRRTKLSLARARQTRGEPPSFARRPVREDAGDRRSDAQPRGVASRRIPQQRGVLGADRIELRTRLSMQLDAQGANDLENGVDSRASVT